MIRSYCYERYSLLQEVNCIDNVCSKQSCPHPLPHAGSNADIQYGYRIQNNVKTPDVKIHLGEVHGLL